MMYFIRGHPDAVGTSAVPLLVQLGKSVYLVLDTLPMQYIQEVASHELISSSG